jgi:hypothetical protein
MWLLRGMMKWISVTEQAFPNDGSYFLCWREENELPVIVMWEAFKEWEEGRLIDSYDYFFHPKYCLYWMPLPDAPEKITSPKEDEMVR